MFMVEKHRVLSVFVQIIHRLYPIYYFVDIQPKITYTMSCLNRRDLLL